MKIGLLLGSFDPIHIGHVCMATSALNSNLVDYVAFVPSMQNPWKEKSTDFDTRCFMIRLTIADIPHCGVLETDSLTQAPHYSYNTLKILKEANPEHEYYLIVGTDVATEIKNWYNGEWILKNFHLITVARPGYEDTGIVDIPMSLDISSTYIRNLFINKKITQPLVHTAVETFIESRNLYKHYE